jgi:hypothetical protein
MKETHCTPVTEDNASPAPAGLQDLSSGVAVTTPRNLQQEEAFNQDDDAESESVKKSEGTPNPEEEGRAEKDSEEEEAREESRENGDLPDYIQTDADQMMDAVYGDHIHQNDGMHLMGGISDNAIWQDYWRRLVVFPSKAYDVPFGAAGKRFVRMVAKLLDGVRTRKWNAETFIVFQMVVLQRTRDVRCSRGIRRWIAWRMDAWEEGNFAMLVQDTERTMAANLTHKQGITMEEQRAKTFHGKMLRGDVCGSVRYLTEREKGGILLPGEINEKLGDEVSKVLESKHPAARTPSPESLQPYPELLDFPDLDITEDAVEKVARRLKGAAGLCSKALVPPVRTGKPGVAPSGGQLCRLAQ